MNQLERRLRALEGRRAGYPYAHLTDEEVQARYEIVLRELEGFGVVFPDSFKVMAWHEQAMWLQRAINKEGAACG